MFITDTAPLELLSTKTITVKSDITASAVSGSQKYLALGLANGSGGVS